MVVLWLGLSMLPFSKHNMWSYYGWVYCCCCPSVNTMCGRIMVGFVVCCRQSVSTICGHIMIGFIVVVVWSVSAILWLVLLLLSSVSKHNMWSYYGWVCRCYHPLVNTTCGRIMVGFVVAIIH